MVERTQQTQAWTLAEISKHVGLAITWVRIESSARPMGGWVQTLHRGVLQLETWCRRPCPPMQLLAHRFHHQIGVDCLRVAKHDHLQLGCVVFATP